MTTQPHRAALITGSSRGIGKGIALALASVGYAVGINAPTADDEVAATVSELNASYEGIGYLLVSAGSAMRMPLAFAGLVVIGAMAMFMYEFFSVMEKRTTSWAHRDKK